MRRQLNRPCLALCALVLSGLLGAFTPDAATAQNEIKIGYMKHPIHEASVAMFEKWGKANGVRVTKVPMAYNIFREKVTATLTSGGDQFDIIWHNDDWGPQWKKWLEPTDDIPGMWLVDRDPVATPFLNDEMRPTAVPMVHTVGAFFYRKDLVKPSEVPTTLDELIKVSKRLQAEDKVKWGYVGGMKMNNTWFTYWWSMWSNKCDVFYPIYERDSKKLAAEGWKPAIADPCTQEIVEYWWDAMNVHKISPKGMVAYGRDEANAIFMAGDAAFTLIDSTTYGTFNDPKKSRVSGKVGIAPFPMGPRRNTPFAWNVIWGWAIPKGVPEERKVLVKQALSAMLLDKEGQVEMWKKTGGPPPNITLWPQIAETDPVFQELKHGVFDQDQATAAAYYFPEWPAVHKAFSDVVTKAITGDREDIGKVLKEGEEIIHRAAVGG